VARWQNEFLSCIDQLKELRKVSMAALLCGNSAEITEIQPKPFQIPSESNPVTPCDDILARTSMRLDPFLQGVRTLTEPPNWLLLISLLKKLVADSLVFLQLPRV
jgi:hypothetical protein